MPSNNPETPAGKNLNWPALVVKAGWIIMIGVIHHMVPTAGTTAPVETDGDFETDFVKILLANWTKSIDFYFSISWVCQKLSLISMLIYYVM